MQGTTPLTKTQSTTKSHLLSTTKIHKLTAISSAKEQRPQKRKIARYPGYPVPKHRGRGCVIFRPASSTNPRLDEGWVPAGLENIHPQKKQP